MKVQAILKKRVLLKKIWKNSEKPENKTAKNKYSSRSLPVLIIANRINF